MNEITCPKCGHKATEVVYAASKIRRGWFCTICRHFEKAIGREVKLGEKK